MKSLAFVGSAAGCVKGFSKLGPGRYVFEVNLSGFTRFRSRLFELHGNQRFQQNVTLNIGNIEERVTVVVSGTRKAAAVNTGVPRRIRVGGNVQAANLVYQVKPIYPQSAGTRELKALFASMELSVRMGACLRFRY